VGAEPVFRRALDIFDRKAPDHPRATDALAALAFLFLDQGRPRAVHPREDKRPFQLPV
jgi:hypothetical protein